MRIFTNFAEATNEIRRDLSEMGITVKPKTYQNKDISNDENMDTKELQNYCYTITDPKEKDLNPTQPWADFEWLERKSGIEGKPLNPGDAWRTRSAVWTEFLNDRGKFDYSYSERFYSWGVDSINKIISRIKKDPDSRQLWCSIWNPGDIRYIGGVARVPCTLGYNFQVRNERINIHYIQRSCDFATHFQNDMYLALRLQEYVANATGYLVGHFSHTIFSMHVYAKDVKDVF